MNRIWAKMSNRERLLAVAVAALVVTGLSYMTVMGALNHLEQQEAMIDHYEQQLINFSRHMERRTPVDAAFGQIAEQHSSQWSGEEIYDRLGSEIYRLARQDPGAPGSPGSGPDIVPIPQLPPGELSANPEGYRSYTVEFKTGDASISNITAFLRRLEESPQALRIEALDIRRPPDQLGGGQATIRVNRTVVDGVEEATEPEPLPDGPVPDRLPAFTAQAAELAPNGSFESVRDGSAEGWLAEGCKLSSTTDFVTDGNISLKVEPEDSGAILAQPLELAGGSSYEMTIDLKSSAALSITVMDEGDGRVYDGAVLVTPDDALRTYTMAFTVAGSGTRTLQVPRFEFEGTEGAAVIDRVRIRPFTGAK